MQQLGKNPIIIKITALLRYEWAHGRLRSRCCHLLLCDTTVPFTTAAARNAQSPVSWGHAPQGLAGHGDLLVTVLLPGFLHARGNAAALPSLPTILWLLVPPGLASPCPLGLLFHLIPITPSPPSPFVF